MPFCRRNWSFFVCRMQVPSDLPNLYCLSHANIDVLSHIEYECVFTWWRLKTWCRWTQGRPTAEGSCHYFYILHVEYEWICTMSPLYICYNKCFVFVFCVCWEVPHKKWNEMEVPHKNTKELILIIMAKMNAFSYDECLCTFTWQNMYLFTCRIWVVFYVQSVCEYKYADYKIKMPKHQNNCSWQK